MIGFNQKNTVDVIESNKQNVGFNKISNPFEFYYKKGSLPYDIWKFQQRCDQLEELGILKPQNDENKTPLKYEDLKLPELMPYRNHTPPYQKERYKQNMKMKSLDTILKYKRENEKASSFQMKSYEKPVRFYKDYFNGDSKIGKQQLIQQSYKSQYEFPTNNQIQFMRNIPNYYASKESSSPLKNLQLSSLHQYKVTASENENYINYNIYNNDFPQVVNSIKKQYEDYKELISNDPSFFQRRNGANNQSLPLAAKQYDPPSVPQIEEPQFKLMTPILPVFVPINEKLPQNYMVNMPLMPSQETKNFESQTTTNNSTVYRDAKKLQNGKFANGQNENRFIEPIAKRYTQQNRTESLNKKYKPDLLPRGDKAGYNMNPHSTAVNVVYQKQINNQLKSMQEIEQKWQQEEQKIISQQKLEEQYTKNLSKIFK
ncbi:hypothetical protein ABPG72_010303 [Tetrahymena utriculariae]